MTVITCGDYTCKRNTDGFCKQAIVHMEAEKRDGKTVVVCQNYEEREDG